MKGSFDIELKVAYNLESICLHCMEIGDPFYFYSSVCDENCWIYKISNTEHTQWNCHDFHILMLLLLRAKRCSLVTVQSLSLFRVFLLPCNLSLYLCSRENWCDFLVSSHLNSPIHLFPPVFEFRIVVCHYKWIYIIPCAFLQIKPRILGKPTSTNRKSTIIRNKITYVHCYGYTFPINVESIGIGVCLVDSLQLLMYTYENVHVLMWSIRMKRKSWKG